MRQNQPIHSVNDLPQRFAVFPLSRVILLPGSRLPLNIFEPRYLAMLDDALRGERVIGMIQPQTEQIMAPLSRQSAASQPALMQVGCLGRLTSFNETGDGRYLITLTGICRFRVQEELPVTTPYRQVIADFSPFAQDLAPAAPADIDREQLLDYLKRYLEHQQFAADWKSVEGAPTVELVNSLAMSCPFETAEKQALLEAPGLLDRSNTLITLIQMTIAGTSKPPEPTLQ